MAGVATDAALRFAVLGPVRVWRGDTELVLGPRQQQQLLALLLVRAGEWVKIDDIVGMLWQEAPPPSAVNLVHRYIGNLRRVLEPNLPVRAAGRWLARNAATYRLTVDDDSLDLHRFRRLAEESRVMTRNGDLLEASRLSRQALDLWRGPCAAGLGDATTSPRFVAVNHEYAALLCASADVARTIGQGEELLPLVNRAAAENPFDERIQSRFLLLLASTGRQADALRSYQTLRRNLADELGIDPGPELQAAHRTILGQVPPPPAAADQDPAIPVTSTVRMRPDQLPPELAAFAGRDDEIAALSSFIDVRPRRPTTTSIVAIDGMPGMGKTTLAVRWAHDIVDRYPDGNLYVNLRGFSEHRSYMPVTEALRGFLTALGVPGDHIPEDEAAQSALLRSATSGKKMLILLDNARDVEQIRPLLPGRSGCLVIVTSRNRLTGLVAQEGAHQLTLGSLPPRDALLALTRRLGESRVAAEEQSAERIIRLCGHMPLAIALAAARAVAHPRFSLHSIAQGIAETDNLLDLFGDTDVGSIFSWSYRLLSPTASRLFRLIALTPGSDFSGEAAASLLGQSMRGTQPVLNELTENSLLNEHLPGRYTTHDLIMAYAKSLARAWEADEGRTAIRRLLDSYLHTGYLAHLILGPNQTWSSPPPPADGVTVQVISDRTAAMAWFHTEYRVLGEAVRLAIPAGFPEHAWRIALTMQKFYQRQGCWDEWEATMEVALEAARDSGHLAGEADVSRSLAGASYVLGRYRESLAMLKHTSDLYTELGYTHEWAYLEANFGTVFNRVGDHLTAIEHFTSALPLYQAQGHRRGEGTALQGIAQAHSKLLNHDEAIKLSKVAMHIFEEMDDLTGVGNCWLTLGDSYQLLGEFDKAIDSRRRAIELYREHGNPTDEAGSLVLLGETYVAAGDHLAARTAFRAGMTIYEDLGLPKAAEIQVKLDELTDLTDS